MATMTIDDKLWSDAWLDTPLGIKRADSREEAMKNPGCCVKSYEKDDKVLHWPKHTGKLVEYSEARVVVRGHGDEVSPKFVWIGTGAEYHRMWECD